MPQYDDHDDLSALDFSARDDSGSHDIAHSDALDFSAAHYDDGQKSGVDALHDYGPPAEPEDEGSELDAILAHTEEEDDEDDGLQTFTVTNPPETVSVSALMDGRIHRVELSPKVTAMTEAELTEEILVIASLARKKGLAGQHTFLLENETLTESMHEMGADDSGLVLRDFMEHFMDLETPEQAAAAQAEVFATRYATDK